MTYVRAYKTAYPQGKRYNGDAQVGGMLSASLELFWKQSESKGVLLVISEKPLGDKKRRQVLRKQGIGVNIDTPTTTEVHNE
jgi:hypothetical protein